ELAKSLLDAARTTFGGLPSEREHVSAIRSRIKLFSKLAETYRTFGDLGAALDAAQTEGELAERVAETGSDGQRDLADGHRQIGAGLEIRGDVAAARKEYDAALDIIAPLAAKDRSDPDLLYDLSQLHLDLGNILGQQSDPAGALLQCEAALAIIAQLSVE